MKKIFLTFLLWCGVFFCFGQSLKIETINPGFEQCPPRTTIPCGYPGYWIYPVPYPGSQGVSIYPGWSSISIQCPGQNECQAESSGTYYKAAGTYYKAGDPAPIELWDNNSGWSALAGNGKQPGPTAADPNGKQFIELNSDRITYVYQDFETPCSGVFTVDFFHKGRMGTDGCRVSAGPVPALTDNNGLGISSSFSIIPVEKDGDRNFQQIASDEADRWGRHTGFYQIPQGQTRTRFRFEAINTSRGRLTVGNFLDDISFTGYLGIKGPTDVELICETSSYTVTIAAASNTITTRVSSGKDSNGNLVKAPQPTVAMQNPDGTSDVVIGPFTTNGIYSYAFETDGCDTLYPLTITVSGNTPPKPSVNAPLVVTLGSAVQLTATSNIPDNVSYLWTGPSPSGPGGTSYISKEQNPIIPNATLFTQGIYTLVTSSKSGNCPSVPVTTTVKIIVPPNSVTGANVCEGEPLKIHYNGGITTGYTYKWIGPNNTPLTNGTAGWSGVSSITLTNSSATQAISGTYTLIITAGANSSSVAGTVLVYPKPTFVTPLVNFSAYTGESISLTADSSIPNSLYSWTGPNGFTSDKQNPVVNSATVLNAGTYTVTVTAPPNSCESVTTVKVTVIPVTPTIRPYPACEGSPLSLEVFASKPNPVLYAYNTNAEYYWKLPDGSTTNTTDPIFTINNPISGTYSVYVKDSNGGGPSPLASVSVTVYPPPSIPKIDQSEQIQACVGSTVILSTPDLLDGSVYFWTGLALPDAGFQGRSISFTTTTSSTYTLTRLLHGCSSVATIFIQTYPPPTIQSIIAPKNPVCPGDAIVLVASLSPSVLPAGGAISYVLKLPDGSTTSTVVASSSHTFTIPSATAAMSGTYTLTVLASGCTTSTITSTSIQVSVFQASTPTIQSNGPVCAGDDIVLTSSITGTAYFWTGPTGPMANSSTIRIPTSTSSISVTTYTLSITTVDGCQSPLATITVKVNPIPILNPMSSTIICVDSPLQLHSNIASLVSPSDVVSYNWSGPNYSSMDKDPIVSTNATLAMAGSYTLTLTVNGCQSLPQSVSVTVVSLPLANAGPNMIMVYNNSSKRIDATASGSTAITYLWEPSRYLSNNTILKPIIINPKENITYKLTVTDIFGCEASSKMSITIPISVPPTITPEHPWTIEGIEAYPDCEIYIYDRWGNERHRSSESDDEISRKNFFDKVTNLPPAAYWYVIKLKDGESIAGTIAIIR